ncbi:MAG: endo-1,4-beta-xylanase, partial [Lentisphaeria bacterium]|nr:endo-1,4-beta-xylanase [Lentisphaeria bacterium]
EPDAKRYRQEIERLYNVVVFESDLKWRSESSDRLAKTEKALEWLRQRHIAVRGHCLVWGSWKYVPASVRTFRDTALRQACQQHVTDYARRFHDKLYIWDVVNEARTNTEVWEETGWKSFADAFRWTADAAPDALRCYNDYAILSGTEETRAGVAERIQYLLDNKAPVDVLGIQAHMTIPLVPMDAILATLDEWAAFGKPLEITEFDLSCTKDLPHAAYFRDFMTAVFSHPKVESFLMWGFWEGRHWRSREGGHMFRLDWSKRPAQDAYEDLVLNQWWTQWEGATGAAGSSTLRAFYGTHRVTVAMNDRTASTEVQLAPGKEATVRLVLE